MNGRRLAIKALKVFSERVMMPFIKWAGKDIAMPRPDPIEYTESTGEINPSVLMAAFQDHIEMLDSDPRDCQSMLNGCMEAYRGSPTISGAALGMFGSLVASGYPPDEAMIRVQANSLMLGMLLQRRLSK